MPIKNYSTKLEYSKIIGVLTTKLAMAGANKIMLEYDTNKKPGAITFAIDIKDNEGNMVTMPFKLPMDIQKIRNVLEKQRVEPRYKSGDGPYNIGWKILLDWVEAQLAIRETEMVDLEEIFLPYLTDGSTTFYQRIKEGNYKELPLLVSGD